MNDYILFLKPVFKERIWGGNRLKTRFNYNINDDNIGECWGISAHENGDCKILNPAYQKMTLSQLFNERKDLFNFDSSEKFPLLIKILDANAPLSVQVHPNDAYALKHENDLGKNECWYVLEASHDAYIIYGHRAKNKKDFVDMIKHNQWDELLIKLPVKTGDFINVPAGTIHALGEGLLILETQQSSDTTYRLYDYDRRDAFNNKRELHIDKSILVSTIPHIDQNVTPKVKNDGGNTFTTLVINDYFHVEKWDIETKTEKKHHLYRLFSVIDGHGLIDGVKIKKGDHFIVTSQVDHYTLEGHMSIITSTVGNL